MRLLLVEDDPTLASNLVGDLRRAGYVADHAASGEEAELRVGTTLYDAVVLDLGLPKRTGLEVLKTWRDQGRQFPILILSARDSWQDRVDGLKLGADDYLGKPFRQEELVARLQALIRRASGVSRGGLEIGGLRLDEDRRRVVVADGRGIELTGTEFRLLRYFMLNPGKVLAKEHLMVHVFAHDIGSPGNLIEVYIKRLREKIGPGCIRTLRGQGYQFMAEA